MFRAKKKALADTIQGLEIKTVIDVGCGLGHILECYRHGGFECMGIDASPTAVAVCLKKGLPARVQRMEDVGQTYDLVSSDGLLEHFLNFELYAKNLMRISRRYVLLIQPNHKPFLGKTLAYLSELLCKDNVLEYNYRIDDFIAVFTENGFQVIDNMAILHDIFRLLLFEKKDFR